MSTPRKKPGPTTSTVLAAVVFAVIGMFLGYGAAMGNMADQCDRYGMAYAGIVAFDCGRHPVK